MRLVVSGWWSVVGLLRRWLRYALHPLPYTLAVLLSCTSGEVTPPKSTTITEQEGPTQVGTDTRVTFSSDGKVRAVLNARGVRIWERQRYTKLDSAVRVDFFDKENKHSSVLTSRRAFINDNTKNMTAYDSVKIVSDSGTVVITDSLLWDNQTHEIRSDAFVRITEKNGRVTNGHGFVSDQDMTNYHILRPIIDAPASAYENPNKPAPLSTPIKPGFGN